MTMSFSPKDSLATKEKLPSLLFVTSPLMGEVTETLTPASTVPEMVTVSLCTVEGVAASSSIGMVISGRVSTMFCVTDLQPFFMTVIGIWFSPLASTLTLVTMEPMPLSSSVIMSETSLPSMVTEEPVSTRILTW